jgi:hypothetical protein
MNIATKAVRRAPSPLNGERAGVMSEANKGNPRHMFEMQKLRRRK